MKDPVGTVHSNDVPLTESHLLKQNVGRTYPVVSHGKGSFLYDVEGKRYLDGSGGAMTASIGHGVSSVVRAIEDQASRVAFSYRTQFTNAPAEELARRLAALAPGDLNWAFFVNSGSEATEFAMRAAIGYWREHGQPDKVKILGRRVSYHGMTMGALSMSGHDVRRPDYGSLLHPFPVASPAHAYRHALEGESEAEYAARTAAQFDHALAEADPKTVAAIIVEPIVGAAGGVLVPPAGYLRRVREICDRHDVLLIMDEVITGMGRTGTWFASSDEGVVPDLLAVGKGLSAGYAAVAGVLLRDHIVDATRRGSGVAPFGHTFSGNPLGAATCVAVLDFMEQQQVLTNVMERGRQLEAGLHCLSEAFPFVADVRGRGLLWGFEILWDVEGRVAPDPELQASATLVDLCFKHGLIVYPGGIPPLNNAVIMSPPLTISEGEIDQLIAMLRDALGEFEKLPVMEPWRCRQSSFPRPHSGTGGPGEIEQNGDDVRMALPDDENGHDAYQGIVQLTPEEWREAVLSTVDETNA